MSEFSRMDRRSALKWVLAAASTAGAFSPDLLRAAEATARRGGTFGIGTDPDLHGGARAGELWPLTLTAPHRKAAAAWCDLIIPADDRSPAASAVGAVDFIDEWISAPYAQQAMDRGAVLAFLAWGDEEAEARFARPFAELDAGQQSALADTVCSVKKARPELAVAARNFAKFRDLTANGFYTTEVGRKDLRYLGNQPLITFDGPPPEALRQAGLAD